jgi:hypothetical protein
MSLQQSQSVFLQVSFLSDLFSSQAIEHERAEGVPDSYLKFHKGLSNINVVFGNLKSRHMDEEMRERVYRGEGLILFCDMPINNPELVEWLGVKVKTLPAKQREQDMEILATEISTAGSFQLLDKSKLVLHPRNKDVVVVGRSMINKKPVMALRKYGSGSILTIAMPLQFNSGVEYMAQLLLNAVNNFSRDVYGISDLTRLLPIIISITNKSSQEKELLIKELLPYGTEAFAYDPKPEEGDELKWKLKLAVSAEKSISYWLQLPDEINDYDIKTEIYEHERVAPAAHDVTKRYSSQKEPSHENKISSNDSMDEVSIGFAVSQKLLSRIDESIVEIDALEATGRDAQYLTQAKQKLESIRNRGGGSRGKAEANLIDAVKAAYYIGEVQDINVSILRLKVQNVMIASGRIYYKIQMPSATRGSFEKPPLNPAKLLLSQFAAIQLHIVR